MPPTHMALQGNQGQVLFVSQLGHTNHLFLKLEHFVINTSRVMECILQNLLF